MSVLLDLDFYRDNGYVLARGVFRQDEVATLRREVAALLERAERAGRKTDATVENGCMCVVPGSQRLGPIEHRNDGNFYLPLDEWPLENAVPVEAQAGDLLLFGYCMVHGSYVNRSDRPRRIVL